MRFGLKPKKRRDGYPLWPADKPTARVLYESDADFHGLYDRGQVATQMQDSDNPMRRQRYYMLPQLVRAIADVPGDICEIGCYRGLSGYVIASVLRELGAAKQFHICDSFEGLSDFVAADRAPQRDMDTPDERSKYICADDIVRANLREFDFVHLHKGWVPAPFAAIEDRSFALGHIDVDLYQPTRDCIEFLYPRLSPRGILVFDDYGSLIFPGAKQAVDEWLAQFSHPLFVTTPSGQAFFVKT